MWRILIPALFLAGCAQLPPSPADGQAKKFDAVPGKSVIYVARARLDSPEGHTLTLDERSTVTTYQGTYYRWEVDPGTHSIAGLGMGTARVTLSTTAGGVYFVRHTVMSDRQDGGVIYYALRQVSDETGRDLVTRGQLVQ